MNSKEKSVIAWYKDPLKEHNAKILEASFIAALIILLIMFLVWQKFRTDFILPRADKDWKPEIIIIPRTVQLKQPPRPAIPSIPVAEEDMDLVESVTLSFSTIDFKGLTESLPPPDDPVDEVPFIKVAVKPKILKKVAPIYPPMARKVGLEGMVVLKVLVGTRGDVEKVEVLKSIPMLDGAAIDAVRKFKFSPGRQRDRYVKVWMSIPFRFELK